MPRSCAVCANPGLNTRLATALQAGTSQSGAAKALGVGRGVIARHLAHLGLAGDGTADGPGRHERAARDLIADRQAELETFSPLDIAEGEHLIACAQLTDRTPNSTAALRELRLALDAYRRNTPDTNPSEARAAADLLARLSP